MKRVLLWQIIGGLLCLNRRLRWKGEQDKLGERGLYAEDIGEDWLEHARWGTGFGTTGTVTLKVAGRGPVWLKLRDQEGRCKLWDQRGQEGLISMALKIFVRCLSFIPREDGTIETLKQRKNIVIWLVFLSLPCSLENGLELTRVETKRRQ